MMSRSPHHVVERLGERWQARLSLLLVEQRRESRHGDDPDQGLVVRQQSADCAMHATTTGGGGLGW